MKNNNFSQQGFSLIELIGVVAIIAILGSLVAPRVLTSIEEAKITAIVQNAQRLNTVVTRYYKDTSQLPNHSPASADPTKHQLISNGAGVTGWKGPYIAEELRSPLTNVTLYQVFSGGIRFDVDGNGADDFFTTATLVLSGLTQAQAMAISDAIDGDADKTGAAAWYKGGKVKTAGSTATSTSIFIMLAGI